jgi:CheY-like chemotaxis protein
MLQGNGKWEWKLRESNPAYKLNSWGSMERKKILVVEDNLDNRRILVYRLRRIGDFDIVEASNGQEALAYVEAEPPDLIFMDLKMPVMDGWEATRRIRKLGAGHRIPIIALTAQAMAGDEQKALAAGCDDYVAKPIVDADVVRRKLERLLYL